MNNLDQTASGLEDSESENKLPAAAQEIVDEYAEKLNRRQQKVAETLTRWLVLGSASLVPVDQYDGYLLLKTSAQHAELIVKAARHDKRVFDSLEKLTQGGDVFALLSFEAILLYALLSHHGRIPKNDIMLQQFGMTEEQVIPKQEPTYNGYSDATVPR